MRFWRERLTVVLTRRSKNLLRIRQAAVAEPVAEAVAAAEAAVAAAEVRAEAVAAAVAAVAVKKWIFKS